MNEGAAPGDIVSDDAFKMRAHRMGGTIYPERTVTDREAVINNSAPTNQPKPKEADIPAATLQRWYYPREKSWVKNDPTNTDSQEVAEKIVTPKMG